ncbi:MAG: glutathione S-transferase family protein [Thalassovita sp.]
MKYFYDPRSGSCRRTSTVLKHLGLEAEWIFLDLIKQDHKAPDYVALNPNAQLPILQDGDVVLWEASAIAIYLCEKAGDTTLWPQGAERDQVTKWMFWAAEHFRQPAPAYFEENFIAKLMGASPDAARLSYAKATLDRYGPILDAHLAHSDFVVGAAPTLADLDLAAPLSQMPRSKVPYDAYPNIMAWSERLANAVPAWAETGKELNDQLDSLVA